MNREDGLAMSLMISNVMAGVLRVYMRNAACQYQSNPALRVVCTL